MRPRLVAAVSAWVLAPVLAAAQIRIGAPAAEAGESAAAGGAVAVSAARTLPVPVLAIGYARALDAPTPALSAGSALLADAPARRWLIQNRPAQYPALARAAYQLSDWEEILSSFDDPRLLLQAVLARKDDPFEKNPAALLALVDRTPSLAARRRLYQLAVLDWSVIGPESRATLGADGASESVWNGLSVSQRHQKLRDVYADAAARSIKTPIGDPEYPAQFEAALMRRSLLMSNAELMESTATLERLKRLSAGLRKAEQAAGASADATAAALLESARTASHISSAESLLDAASRRLGLAPAEPAPAGDESLDAAQRQAVTARLGAAFARDLSGTPLGAEILAAVEGDRINLAFERGASRATIAQYGAAKRRVVIAIGPFESVLSELGLTPRDLLTDDEALADVAAVYSHIFVHETTHHRQKQGDSALPPAARSYAYNRRREVEAVLAEAVFLRQKRTADPDFAAREARLLRSTKIIAPTLLQPESLAGDPARMAKWLENGYTDVPTLSRSAARMVDQGIAEERVNAPCSEMIDRELGRRRRLPRDERAALQNLGDDSASMNAVWQSLLSTRGLRQVSTRGLRRVNAEIQSRAHAMVLAAESLIQRSEDALRALESQLRD